MGITKGKVLSDFNTLVSLAESLYEKKRYESCFATVKTAAFLMYNFNIIYTEERLENLLHKVGDVYFSAMSSCKDDKTVLFYDWWCLETRGLSNIYINALLQNGYKVVVVTKNSNRNKIDWLYTLLGENGAVEFFDTRLSYKKQCGRLSEIYGEHPASCAFLHTMPDDVAGCAFFAKLPCKRYLVNLTDHAFWLGSTCADFSIEFRDYGYTVSKNYRNIPEKNLVMLPYYPVHKTVRASDMQDFFASHTKLVVSGGSLYKIAGNPVFFEIVSYILNRYKDSTFVFIGGGDASNINQFIKDNGFENRCFYFAERPDFEDFIRHAKFYLCTYPVNGALMSQIAVVNKKIPLCFNPGSDEIARDADMESFFVDTGHNPQMSFTTLAELKEEIDRLFSDEEYLVKKESQLEGMVISEKEFAFELNALIKSDKNKFCPKERKLNLEEFSQIYMDAENNENRQYNLYFARSKSAAAYIKFPVKSFCGIVKAVARKLKK